MAAVVVLIAPIVTALAVIATWFLSTWRLSLLRRVSRREFATQTCDEVVAEPTPGADFAPADCTARRAVMVHQTIQTLPVRFEVGEVEKRTMSVQGPDTWMRHWSVPRRKELPSWQWGAVEAPF